MLIELAIGDAYGAGFEYVTDEIIRAHNDLSGYIQHPRHGLRAGQYTDDTQMSLALAEALIEQSPWNALTLAQRFVDVFKRDQRTAYAPGYYQFLLTVADGEDFLRRIRPDSDRSGSAMRACPLGVLPCVDAVIDASRIQAAITHNTPDGISAASAAALMSHYFLYRLGPKNDVGHFLASIVPGPWATTWIGKVGLIGWMSVQAAVTAIVASERMTDLLKRCIDFTGDVDTVAAIALGSAAACQEIDQDLPDHLYQNLENGPFGREYVLQLDKRLLSICKS